MGQYKVPQDVEAEDKILGPLTLKQFIYTVIAVAYGALTFKIFQGAPVIFIIVGVPPTILFLLLGLYRRQDQPFETFFLALVTFYFKPRRRIWMKDPLIEAFKIEQPKITPEAARRDPREVRGQLEKLAAIVDTRGWAAKQPEVQVPTSSGTLIDSHERLVTQESLNPQPITPTEIELTDDILDFENNPNAQNLNVLIENAVKDIREEAVEKMKVQLSQIAATAPAPAVATTESPAPAPISPVATTEVAQAAPTPASEPPPAQPQAVSSPTPEASVSEMTGNPIAGILKLAMDNSDLTVSQLSAQAQKQVPLAEGESVSLRPAEAVSPQT